MDNKEKMSDSQLLRTLNKRVEDLSGGFPFIEISHMTGIQQWKLSTLWFERDVQVLNQQERESLEDYFRKL